MFDYVLTIDTNAIVANYSYLQSITKAKIGAVVKANAYGLGANNITQALEQHCPIFCVARLDEAIELRENGIKSEICVLHGFFKGEEGDLAHYQLIPTLNSLEQVKIWEKYTISQNKPLPCILHIDTGINRLGVSNLDIDKIKHLDLNIIYIISHLSCANQPQNDYNKKQLNDFMSYSHIFPKAKRSFANSHGIFLGKDYHFDLVRPGYALYGLNPTSSNINPMQNTFTLTAKILQIKTLTKDEYIGYECTAKANKNSIIATIPIGYANGYSTFFSNKGKVYINGQIANVIGRISMDLITIDITDIHCNIGDDVEIVGPNITVSDLATISGISQYEILTSLKSITNRIYK